LNIPTLFANVETKGKKNLNEVVVNNDKKQSLIGKMKDKENESKLSNQNNCKKSTITATTLPILKTSTSTINSKKNTTSRSKNKNLKGKTSSVRIVRATKEDFSSIDEDFRSQEVVGRRGMN
jgi:hypothetical protein